MCLLVVQLVQMYGASSRRLHKRLQSSALLLNADRFDDGSCSVGLGLAGALEQLFEFFGAPMGTRDLFAHLRRCIQAGRTDGRGEEATQDDEVSHKTEKASLIIHKQRERFNQGQRSVEEDM